MKNEHKMTTMDTEKRKFKVTLHNKNAGWNLIVEDADPFEVLVTVMDAMKPDNHVTTITIDEQPTES